MSNSTSLILLTMVRGNFGFPGTWIRAYAAITRANSALRALRNLSDDEFPKKQPA